MMNLELLQILLEKLAAWLQKNGLISSELLVGDDTSSDAEDSKSDVDSVVDAPADGLSAFVDSIVRKVQAVLNTDWKAISYSRISESMRSSMVGQPVKIRGSIARFADVKPCYQIRGGIDTLEFSIEDRHGDQIDVSPIASTELINKLQIHESAHNSLDFFGTVVPAKPHKGSAKSPVFKFFLCDVAVSESVLQMVAASPVELTDTKRLLRTLSRRKESVLEHVKKELVGIVAISGLDESPLLELSLDLAIYQALSDGYDVRRSLSQKIHSLVIGPPAVGKKLITESIRILNPAVTEAHPGKVTVAGLSGAAIRRNGAWTSTPGLIPQAHRGVTVIQDFHHVTNKQDLMGVLSLVMEDGRVIDATAAKKIHLALTSLHLDLNRKSHVSPSSVAESEDAASVLSDLGLTMNVLSRFDFIAEIPRDTERQMEIALAMQSAEAKTTAFVGETNVDGRIRAIKVLMAYLRDTYADITIPEELAKNYVRPRAEELLSANRDKLGELNLLGDFQTRLANSVHKLVFAIARASLRNIAVEADVDEAFRFISCKMRFLQTIEKFEIPATWGNAKQSRTRTRRDFISKRFAGQEFTVSDVLKAVRSELDPGIGERSVRRDLDGIAVSSRFGYFHINVNVKPSEDQSDKVSN